MSKPFHKIAIGILLFAFLAGPCGTAAAADLASQQKFEKIDAFISSEMKQCRIPGFSVGIVKGEEIVYLKGYGDADPAGRQVTPQTPFQVASLTKSFTAIGIMQLVEAGKLDLDKPVQTYIPWFRVSDPQASSAITVCQLLNHTSGFATDAEAGISTLRGDDTSIEQLVRNMSGLKPAEEAGTVFQYSNVNYIILGQIIQSVSGLTYQDYITRSIFEPLGMVHSYLSEEDAKKDGMAVGYRTVFGYPAPVSMPYRTDFLSTSGVISCAEDLSKYVLALLNRGEYKGVRILSENGVAELMAPSSPVSKWVSYGLGWYVTSGSVYHGGELTNFQSKIKMLPEDGLGVVILYNTSNYLYESLFHSGYRERIESGIISILYGEEPDAVQPGSGILDLNRYPMQVTYYLYLGLCILIVLFLVFSAVKLKSIKKKLLSDRKPSWAGSLLFGLIYLALPLLMLLAAPAILHSNWRFLLYYSPDAGWFSLVASVMLLAIGLAGTALTFRHRSGRP